MKLASLLHGFWLSALGLCNANEQSILDSASTIIDADVVVVGAGMSGLSAARTLLEANKTVAILEGRDRVGGKVRNHYLDNGGVTEVGAAFVGPTQDRVLALADELGLETFLEYNEGSNVAFFGAQMLEIPAEGGVMTGLDASSLAALATIDTMAASIDVSGPWSHSNASLWDSMTFGAYLDNAISNDTVRALLDVSTAAVWSANPEELSLLYVVSYIAAAGNATTTGSLHSLLDTAEGAQQRRIVGGTGLLPRGLADKIGWDKILLNAPVESVSLQPSGRYLVTASSVSVTAADVIIAMAPPLAARINYDPPLPAHRDQLSQRMFMGAIGKATAIYKTPFWREAGLSGQAASTTGTVRTTFDVSPANGSYGAMLGFIVADPMRELDTAPLSEIRDLVTEDYVRYFGPKAADVEQWVIQRWDNEVYSRGAPTALAGSGTLTRYGTALREACGGIHWAGTEAAEYWIGYMDGAIRSGERAAREVLGRGKNAVKRVV